MRVGVEMSGPRSAKAVAIQILRSQRVTSIPPGSWHKHNQTEPGFDGLPARKTIRVCDCAATPGPSISNPPLAGSNPGGRATEPACDKIFEERYLFETRSRDPVNARPLSLSSIHNTNARWSSVHVQISQCAALAAWPSVGADQASEWATGRITSNRPAENLL